MSRFQIYAGVLTTLCLGWAVLVTVVPGVAAGKRVAEDFRDIPLKIDGWRGSQGEFSDAATVYDILSTASLVSRQYYHDAYTPVSLSIVFGLDLGDFHQPEVCMGGAGWTLVDQKLVTVNPKGMPSHQAVLNLMKNDMGGELALLYWFYMGGQVVASRGGGQMSQAFQDAFRARRPAAMVKFTAMVDGDAESSTKADIALCEALEADIVRVVSRTPKYEDSKLAVKRLKAAGAE